MVDAKLIDDSSIHEKSYRECLDEWGSIRVAGTDFEASEILEKLDPVAYSCGLNDYADGMDDVRECGQCGKMYDDKQEAEDCCAERTDEEIEEYNREVEIYKKYL